MLQASAHERTTKPARATRWGSSGFRDPQGYESPVPGRVRTDSPVPGRVGTDSPVPGRVGTDSPVPGRVGTDSPVPGRVGTDSPVPGRVRSVHPSRDGYGLLLCLLRLLLCLL